MHNPESALENETQKILWDFNIQTDHWVKLKESERTEKIYGTCK